MDSAQVKRFNHHLLKWFYEKKRDLPWRRTKNPYYIWISEVMLQQTQVDTVIPYYLKFIKRFPTVDSLAQAPEQSVLKYWEGLGYYSRARNLQQGVREVATRYDGNVPENKTDLLSIRGIGPYTAGAILSIAFDEPEPAVDGNVMRVISRIFLIDDDVAKVKTKKKFEQIVGELIAETDPSAFNQSLMELGAMICRPKHPKCGICPVKDYCKACDEGVQHEYPVKSRKAEPRQAEYAVILIEDADGRILIEQRPDKGLLAGMWQFPMIELTSNNDNKSIPKIFSGKYGWHVPLKKSRFSYTHRFSHLIWNLLLYEGRLDHHADPGRRSRWADRSELNTYPFPVPHQKVIEWMIEKNRQEHT
ncbi:A/G-specific adenine glycosylase [Sporolactobacillus sp. THM7-4]|nr:A/G-specific adenine glycosylase [Sporolactobacillus sp. THM7-4]